MVCVVWLQILPLAYHLLGVVDLRSDPGISTRFNGQASDSTTTKDYSWWPKQSTWFDSGAYVGYWSSANEEWFQKRLQIIRDNKASPMNAREWRDNLRYQRPTTQAVLSKVEELCRNVL